MPDSITEKNNLSFLQSLRVFFLKSAERDIVLDSINNGVNNFSNMAIVWYLVLDKSGSIIFLAEKDERKYVLSFKIEEGFVSNIGEKIYNPKEVKTSKDLRRKIEVADKFMSSLNLI